MSPLGRFDIAMAAAHGITERTIATWNAQLPRDPRVLVPIQVDALVVRTAGAQWADTLMTRTPADAGGTTVPAKSLLPKPFALRDQAREPGVYLHWALPEALTSGSQATDGSTLFPALPDRWLITRIFPSPSRADRRAVRSWILQAHDDDPQPVDLDSWSEPGSPPDGIKNPLTALGYGDVSWAGFFDNTRNRLAFYDDLKDVPLGPVAYLVCGWFSDPALDPVGPADVHSLAEFNARMSDLGWALPTGALEEPRNAAAAHVVAARAVGLGVSANRFAANVNRFENAQTLTSAVGPIAFDPASGSYNTAGSWWPQMTLLHGAVVGIGWPQIGWEGHPSGVWNPGAVAGDSSVTEPVGGPPSAASIGVAIGNTMTEALAKLVASDPSRADETRILEAFQLNALDLLNAADGAAQVDSLLHTTAFGSLPGDQTTETIWQPPTSVNQAPPANPPQPDLGVFQRYQHSPHHAGTGVLQTAGTLASRQSAVRSAPVREVQLTAVSAILSGNLSTVVDNQPPDPQPPPQPGQWIDVQRTLPRFFHPTDPILLIRGGQASFKHAPAGFSQDGLLYCRLSGDTVTGIASTDPGATIRIFVRGADLLERGIENGSVPPESDDLLKELAALDPGSALAAAHSATTPSAPAASIQAIARSLMVEQTAWHSVRDPRIDHGPLIAHSGVAGRLPSALAVSLPAHPWNPIRLDWRVDYLPSSGGLNDWALGEIDYALQNFNPGDATSFEDSCPLTPAANRIVANAIRNALAQAASAGGSGITQPGKLVQFFSQFAAKAVGEFQRLQIASTSGGNSGSGVPADDRAALDDIASALSNMDVLTGGLDGLITFLRGGFSSDGVSRPASGDPAPDPFFAMRQGFLRITRLRLVDGFGQFVDLLDPQHTGTADASAIVKSDPMSAPNDSGLVVLTPRFTAPARLWFRWMDAGGSGAEAKSNPQTGSTNAPVCGYLMPNHLDGALEFFDAGGTNLGFVREQDDRTIGWEEAPGQPSTLGQDPARAIPNRFAAGIAQSLVQWGVADAGLPNLNDNALQAMLRVVDSSRWSIDPFGHAGDEHLSLLVGHPIVIARARIRLELQEPVRPDLANLNAVPIRLGALAHWQDGLFGYFVDDDYTVLHCADAAVAGLAREIGPNQGFLQPINLVPDYFSTFASSSGSTPVTHPYVDTSGVLWIRPNQSVDLTLLVEPHTVVHATSGLLPRKDIGLRREWTSDALSTLSPTFRFGPLLVDPKRIRMPIPTDIAGTWSWDYRSDASAWADAPVTHATQDALLPADPPSGTEGWLRLTPPAEHT